ncbi:hypothetical protein ACEPAG_5760 [Sanghuangporus baumii]
MWKLWKLKFDRDRLPDSLPYSNQFYFFENFAPDPEKVDLIGSVAWAVNDAFEIVLAPKGRHHGIELKERGPELVTVVDVLRRYTEAFSADVVLQKWILDLIEAGMNAGGSVESIDAIMPELRQAAPDTLVTAGQKRKNTTDHEKDQPKKHGFVLSSSAVNSNFVQVDWDEVDAMKGKGGRKRDPPILSLVIPGYDKDDKKKTIYFCCIGLGCGKMYDKRSYCDRYFAHILRCSHLPAEIKQHVSDTQANRSLGHDLASSTHTTSTSSSSSSSSSSFTAPPTSTGPLDLTRWARSAGRTELNKKINFAVLQLLCCRGIPSHIIDSKAWKDVLRIASSGQHEPIGTKAFVDTLIPREAAHIHTQQIKLLQKFDNLTISFDGGTTAGLQSVYMVHVTTPDRRAYLLEGNEASEQSHTGDHLFGVLDQVSSTFFDWYIYFLGRTLERFCW